MDTWIIKQPPPNHRLMGDEQGEWCEYHRAQGHDIENYVPLESNIEKVIQNGHVVGYLYWQHYC